MNLSRDEEDVGGSGRAIRSYGDSGKEEGAKVFRGVRHYVRIIG